MSETLVERIYEAAFIPERWDEVLQSLAVSSGGVSAALLLYNGMKPPRWRSTPLIEEVLSGYCTSDAWQKSELTPYMLNVPPADFFYDADYFPEHILARDLMRAPLRELGIGNQVGALISMPTGENVCITIERASGSPRPQPEVMSALARMRPHLARAGLIAARLGIERAQAAVSILSTMGLPAAVLTSSMSVLAANSLLEDMEGAVVFTAMGKIALRNRAANLLFQQGIGEATASALVKSIPVAAEQGSLSFIVHILPIEGAAHDIFTNAATAVVITPIDVMRAPEAAMLNGLFDLTPAEARLAKHLANGETVGETADALGVSVTTLRSHLRSIFAKTGTSRQAELTGMLSSLGSVRLSGRKKP